MSARDRGADISDSEALTAFLADVRDGRLSLDEDLLGRVLKRQLGRSAPGQERKFAQLPVSLPPPEELAAAAGRSKVAGQLRAFADWLGPGGRVLTSAGNIRPADARELITLLGTGDEGLRFHSAAELPGLDLMVNWAKKVRLVRKQGTRLVPVAKARPVLADAEALWQRAFEAAFDLGNTVCPPIWADEPPSPVRLLYEVIVPDVLAAIYSMDEPVPVARLAEPVWETVRAHLFKGAAPARAARPRPRWEGERRRRDRTRPRTRAATGLGISQRRPRLRHRHQARALLADQAHLLCPVHHQVQARKTRQRCGISSRPSSPVPSSAISSRGGGGGSRPT